MQLHEVEKQLIKYTKGHFKRIDYYNDLKYFASELYGIGEEHIDQYNILHMVIDLYESLVKNGYIDFRLKFFLSDVFKRASREENKHEVSWHNVIREMLAEIQGIPVKGLELGETNLSIIPEAVINK